MPKESSETRELLALVLELKDNKELIPRKRLLEIVDNEKRLTRRLQTIRETFTNLFLVQIDGEGYRLISKRIEVKTKTAQKKAVLHIGVNPSIQSLNGIIDAAYRAKVEKRQLVLQGYKRVSGEAAKDYTVSVIDLVIENDPYIYAVTDSAKDTIKTFKLSRVGSTILKTAKSFAGELTAEGLLKDDFGFLIKQEGDCKKMCLLMNNYSLNMVSHDFPFMVDRVTEVRKADVIKETVDGVIYEYRYQLNIRFSSYKPLRVVIGLLNQIKVVADEETLAEFRAFIEMTVMESVGRNLIRG